MYPVQRENVDQSIYKLYSAELNVWLKRMHFSIFTWNRSVLQTTSTIRIMCQYIQNGRGSKHFMRDNASIKNTQNRQCLHQKHTKTHKSAQIYVEKWTDKGIANPATREDHKLCGGVINTGLATPIKYKMILIVVIMILIMRGGRQNPISGKSNSSFQWDSMETDVSLLCLCAKNDYEHALHIQHKRAKCPRWFKGAQNENKKQIYKGRRQVVSQ